MISDCKEQLGPGTVQIKLLKTGQTEMKFKLHFVLVMLAHLQRACSVPMAPSSKLKLVPLFIYSTRVHSRDDTEQGLGWCSNISDPTLLTSKFQGEKRIQSRAVELLHATNHFLVSSYLDFFFCYLFDYRKLKSKGLFLSPSPKGLSHLISHCFLKQKGKQGFLVFFLLFYSLLKYFSCFSKF